MDAEIKELIETEYQKRKAYESYQRSLRYHNELLEMILIETRNNAQTILANEIAARYK